MVLTVVAPGPGRACRDVAPTSSAAEQTGEATTERGFSRTYWDVHASDGAVYRVHQDGRDGRWFLDGYYD